MKERFEQLDSLRGLAALAVLFEHFLQVLPAIGDPDNWNETTKAIVYSPLRMLWGGHEAVVFFFVLSGFVLSLPYYGNRSLPYFTFMKRRIFRIYVPYAVAIAVAIGTAALLHRSELPAFSDWFNRLGTDRITPGLVFNHLLLIGGDYDYKAFDTVIWTLIHEMRIAFLFPVLMLLVLGLKPGRLLLLCVAFSLVGFVVNNMLLSPEYSFIYYFITIHYVSMFVIGALVAKYREQLIGRFRALSRRTKGIAVAAALLLYSYSYWFAPGIGVLHKRIIDDWVISGGVVVIIVASLASGKARSMLTLRPVAFLGKVSYSLYLYHFIVLTACIRLLAGALPIYAILLIAFALTLLVSYLSYRYVELPSIRLGKIEWNREKKRFHRLHQDGSRLFEK